MANIVDGNIMLEVTRLVEDDLLNLKMCGLEGKGKGSLHVALFEKVRTVFQDMEDTWLKIMSAIVTQRSELRGRIGNIVHMEMYAMELKRI